MGAYLTIDDLLAIEAEPEKLYGTPLQRRGIDGLLKTWHSSHVMGDEGVVREVVELALDDDGRVAEG